MIARAIASLSVYLPAYYTYILPIFLPVITYNYLTFESDRVILANMFLLLYSCLSYLQKLIIYC